MSCEFCKKIYPSKEEYKELFESHWDEEKVIVKDGDEYWIYIPMDDYFYSGNYLQINYCPQCGRKLTEEE